MAEKIYANIDLLSTPNDDKHVVNKKYVDDAISDNGAFFHILGTYASETDLKTDRPIGNKGEGYLIAGHLWIWSPGYNTWIDAGSIQGPKGEDGRSVNILGSYESEAALTAAHPTGNTGDSYLVNGSLYVWAGSAWTNVGYIQGPPGEQGNQGEIGPQGPQGIQGPKGDKGNDGTSIKILGSYLTEEALKGEQITGEFGDCYLVQGDVYVWNGTTWENVGNISGPKGDTGEQGPKGDKGDTGTSITILGSYESEAALKTAHPTGTVGQGYLVMGALYVWNGTAWENVGYLQGPQGEKGNKGDKGDKGDTGTIKIEYILDDDNNSLGVKLSSESTGTSANVLNGKDGAKGADGISPTATVVETDNGAIVTITDKNGTTTANLKNGKKGDKGDDGEDGVGIASVVKTGTAGNIDTYTITFTDTTTTTFTVTNSPNETLTKISQLDNDSGFILNTVNNLVNYYGKDDTYTKTEVEDLVGRMNGGLSLKITENLNAEIAAGVSSSTIYLVETSEGSGVYTQYIWMTDTSTWATIGTTAVDLSNYYNKSDIDTKLSLYASIAFLTSMLAAYTPTSALSKVALSNNYNDLDNLPTIPSIEGLASTTYVDQKVADSVDTTAVHPEDLADVATTGDYSDLLNKPTIPSINGLATTNYVDEQIGAIPQPDLSAYRKKTDAISYNDLNDKPKIPIVDEVLNTNSLNAIQNKAVADKFAVIETKLATDNQSPVAQTQATAATATFGYAMNYQTWRCFAEGPQNCGSSDGEVNLIISAVGDFGWNSQGVWVVSCSTRGGPSMRVLELVAPGGVRPTFAYWVDDGRSYFGVHHNGVYGGATAVTVISRPGNGQAYTAIIKAGVIAEHRSKPKGWTPVQIAVPQVTMV